MRCGRRASASSRSSRKRACEYAKPAGVIAGLLPVTNPLVTMVNMAINAIKCKDAVIFSPHPMSRKTALEIARVSARR